MSELYLFIYETVKKIPIGKVATYGQIASLTGNPKRSRVIGYALSSCSDKSVPCHRVVSRFGGLSDNFSPEGKATQRMLLSLEGVTFLMDGNVDIEKFRHTF